MEQEQFGYSCFQSLFKFLYYSCSQVLEAAVIVKYLHMSMFRGPAGMCRYIFITSAASWILRVCRIYTMESLRTSAGKGDSLNMKWTWILSAEYSIPSWQFRFTEEYIRGPLFWLCRLSYRSLIQNCLYVSLSVLFTLMILLAIKCGHLLLLTGLRVPFSYFITDSEEIL
jgi:hypothetical protein